MRCLCCNSTLTAYESTRKHAETNEYLDTCGTCLSVINESVHIPTLERPDLLGSDDLLDSDHDSGLDDLPESW